MYTLVWILANNIEYQLGKQNEIGRAYRVELQGSKEQCFINQTIDRSFDYKTVSDLIDS